MSAAPTVTSYASKTIISSTGFVCISAFYFIFAFASLMNEFPCCMSLMRFFAVFDASLPQSKLGNDQEISKRKTKDVENKLN